MIVTINLNTPKKSVKSLKGSSLGYKYRSLFSLDDKDQSEDTIYVNISTKLYSMDYDFYTSMFGQSIDHLGLSKFNTKYQFISGNRLRNKLTEFSTRYSSEHQHLTE